MTRRAPTSLAKWDGAWPNCSGTARTTSPIARRPRSVETSPLPHTHITKYIAGAHYGAAPGPQCGYSVILWKTRTIDLVSHRTPTSIVVPARGRQLARSAATTISRRSRTRRERGPYNLPNNWYAEYNPRPTSRTSGAAYHLNDDATGSAAQSLQTPDQNGHSWWWDGAVNPMSGTWAKVEMELKYTNATDGYIKLWENGVLKIDYHGATDQPAR